MNVRVGRCSRAWLLAILALLAGIGLGTASAQLDAAGDGSLRPPTAPRYSDPAWYDLQDVRLLEGDPIRMRVTLAAIDGSGGLPVGITQPIIEVYLDTEPGGAEALLPGSGLSMPLGEGWQLAFRITGDGAWGWQADPLGGLDLAAPVPIEVIVDGRDLTLLTPFRRPDEPPRVYAISGVYDPFRPDGWRPLTRDVSPWAFSSPSQVVPVVDVFPSDLEQRAAALARGELPRQRTSGLGDLATWTWIGLMLVGLAVALSGVVLRLRSLRQGAPQAAAVATEASSAMASTNGAAYASHVDGAGSGPELIGDVDLPPALVAPRRSADRSDGAGDEPAGRPTDEPAGSPTVEGAGDMPTDEPADEPKDEGAGDMPTDEPADEPKDEGADDERAEAPTDEAADRPAEDMPADASAGEPAAIDQADEDAPADGTEREASDDEAEPDSSQTSAPSDASRDAKRS